MDQDQNADQEPNPNRNLINDFEAEDPVEDLTALIENINIQDYRMRKLSRGLGGTLKVLWSKG